MYIYTQLYTEKLYEAVSYTQIYAYSVCPYVCINVRKCILIYKHTTTGAIC